MIVVGPWQWQDTGAGFAWTGPSTATGSLDLRPIEACAHRGGAPQGLGVFDVPACPSAAFTVLADDATALVSAETVAAFTTALGLSAYPVRPQLAHDLLWEILTEHADPLGQRLAPPLMPMANGELVLILGAFRRSRPLHVGDPEWPRVQAGYQQIYRATLADVTAGRAPVGLDRKLLTTFLRTMGTNDHTLFIPPDLPVVTPLEPTTTITDNFTRADANPISPSPEGWSWNNLSGTWFIIANRCRCMDNEAFTRAERDVASVNHAAQTTDNKSGSNAYSGVVARFSSTASTGYLGFCHASTLDCRISTLIAGTRSDLSPSGSGGVPNAGSIVRIEANGSSLQLLIDGVVVKTVTNTTISTGTRTGMWAYGGDDRTAFLGADLGPAGAVLSATPGVYALTGTAATLRRGLRLTANPGSYAAGGTPAALRVGHTLPAAPGTYSASGTPATLRAGRVLAVASGATFTWTGTAAAIRAARRLGAGAGVYTLTGTAAALVYHRTGITLDAAPGNFALVGSPATLRLGRRLTVTGGTFTIAGLDAALRAARRLGAAPGLYTWTGTAANLIQGTSGASARDPMTTTFVICLQQATTFTVRRDVRDATLTASQS